MDSYKLYAVVSKILKFLEELTNWYVRLNRSRMKGEEGVVE
jgi:isoleucyl-tRNA synthetase